MAVLLVLALVGATIGEVDGARSVLADDAQPWRTDCTNGSPDGWAFHAEVSQDDGLVVDQARLGVRPMVRRVSVPYFVVKYRWAHQSSVTLTQRVELTHDGHVEHDIARAPLAGPITCTKEGTAAKFTLDIDPPNARLEITQDYRFAPSRESDVCEPSNELRCARFWPTTRWRFTSDESNIELVNVRMIQRFDFLPDANPIGTRAVFRDLDTLGAVKRSPTLLRRGGDVARPMAGLLESRFLAVDEGRRAKECKPQPQHAEEGDAQPEHCTWDNYHQSPLDHVQPPAIIRKPHRILPVPTAGCPECVHVHWAWSRLVNVARGPLKRIFNRKFTNAKPLLLKGSKQTVHAAVVVYRPREIDPVTGYEALANQERFDRHVNSGHPILFWDATSPGISTRNGKTDETFPYLESRHSTPSSIFFAPAQPADKCLTVDWRWSEVKPYAKGWSLPIRIRSSDPTCKLPLPAFVSVIGGPQLLNPHQSYAETPCGAPFVILAGQKERALTTPLRFTLLFDGDPSVNRPSFPLSTRPVLGAPGAGDAHG